jgi:hypothetical protein
MEAHSGGSDSSEDDSDRYDALHNLALNNNEARLVEKCFLLAC